ncbi:DUF11 domain-containing protein [Luteimonas sp. e5]
MFVKQFAFGSATPSRNWGQGDMHMLSGRILRRGIVRVAVGFLLVGLPLMAQAQDTSDCSVNHTHGNIDFAVHPWPPGSSSYSATPHPGFQVTATAQSAHFTATAPRTATDAAGATMLVLSERFPDAGVTRNASVTFTFERPVSNLALRVSDLDHHATTLGAYFDRVTVTGKAADGSTLLPVTANRGSHVTAAGNVAWARTNQPFQCNEASQEWAACRIDFLFPSPVKEFTLIHDNHPAASGNPPVQQIRMRLLGFCAPNAADLAINKTTDPALLLPGENVTYTIIASNQGPDPVTGAVVRDTPGGGLVCLAGSAVDCSGDACPSGPLTMAELTTGITLGPLTSSAPGNSVTFTATCQVTP